MEEPKSNKFIAVLTSRKAWAAIISILITFGVDALQGLDPDTIAAIVGTVAAVYMGSVALEDGLAKLADGLASLRTWWNSRDFPQGEDTSYIADRAIGHRVALRK